jgi:hypothetical protein
MKARIAMVSQEVLQCNRVLVDYFTTSWYTGYCVDKILAGVYPAVQDMDANYQLFERFKDYIDEEEARMKKKLQSVMYCIDAPNTLSLVTGPSRLEKVCAESSFNEYDIMSVFSICFRSYISCSIGYGMSFGAQELSHLIPRKLLISWARSRLFGMQE